MKVRTLTADDKVLVAGELLNSGIKSRIKMLRIGIRVCFEGSWEVVARVLNENGYVTASGTAFDRHSFNNINGEVFVRYAK